MSLGLVVALVVVCTTLGFVLGFSEGAKRR